MPRIKQITVVHCWSAPRSRSTALLYSFEARGQDCAALDEPLYTAWLKTVGDTVSRPYTKQLIEGIPPENATPEVASKWRRELLTLEERVRKAAELLPDRGIIFCKEMAKFEIVYDFNNEASAEDLDIQLHHKHLLLLRDPVAVLSSWSAAGTVHDNNPTMNEVGVVPLLSIYSTLQGRDIAILDSDELASDPSGALKVMCADLGISFKEEM